MKDGPDPGQSEPKGVPSSVAHSAQTLDFGSIFMANHAFVCRSLSYFGVGAANVEDLAQEVFLVLHRRLEDFDRGQDLRSWLFGIARRVAAGYRRRAYHVRERVTAEPHAEGISPDSPEENAEHARARDRMEAILERMTLDQRAVFVMFELDGMTGAEIAELMDCPLQTVFSRLRRARETFERHVSRLRATEERRAG